MIKNRRLWDCAKYICMELHTAKTFTNGVDLKQFVKNHKNLLPSVVNGWDVSDIKK